MKNGVSEESDARGVPRERGRRAAAMRAWWALWWRALLCETLAGFNMELVARLAQLPRVDPMGELTAPPLEHSAFAFGCLVLANVHAFGRVSGGYSNPAVAVAAAVAGRVSWALAAAYSVAECLGATLGFAFTHTVAPLEPFSLLPSPCNAVPIMPERDVAVAAAEFSMAAALALFACASWRPAGSAHGAAPARHPVPPPDPLLSIKFGLLLMALTYGAAWTRGASVNPARAAAAALWLGCWRAHWVYWVGPLAGAAAAAALYRYVLVPIPAHRRHEFLF